MFNKLNIDFSDSSVAKKNFNFKSMDSVEMEKIPSNYQQIIDK